MSKENIVSNLSLSPERRIEAAVLIGTAKKFHREGRGVSAIKIFEQTTDPGDGLEVAGVFVLFDQENDPDAFGDLLNAKRETLSRRGFTFGEGLLEIGATNEDQFNSTDGFSEFGNKIGEWRL